MNLRSKLALGLMAVMLIPVGALAIGSASAARSIPRQNVDTFLREVALEVREGRIDSARDLTLALRTDDDSRRPGQTTLFQVLVVNANGDVTVEPSNRFPVNQNDLEIAREGESDSLRDVEWNDVNYRMLTFSVGESGAIQIVRDIDDADKLVKGMLPRIALWGATGTLLAGLFGWLFAGRIANPLSRLAASAERVADTRDLAERIPVARSDEVGRVATSFNTMLGALETSQRQQNQLVLDANHELRTPLTSLRTNIEVLQRNHDRITEADRAQVLHDVNAELNELTDLVSELVDSATAIGSTDEPFEEIELSDLVHQSVELTRRRTGRIISFTLNDPALVTIQPSRVTRAVQNLLSNANKFSPEGTPISVDVTGTRVTVSDSGPGISPEDQPYAFDRFYRSTAARTQPGSGLGLAIVKQVADQHEGVVAIGTSSTGGASVSLDLQQSRVRTLPIVEGPAHPTGVQVQMEGHHTDR